MMGRMNEKRERREEEKHNFSSQIISLPLQICRFEPLLAVGSGLGMGCALILSAGAALGSAVSLAAVDADEDEEEEGEDGPDRHGDHGLLRNVI